VDLAEEFARLHGLDRIPLPESPRAQRVPGADDRPAQAAFACRQQLAGLGLREIMNYSLVSERLLNLFDPGDAPRRVALSNPISAEQTILRTALLPQLVETLGRNRARQIGEAALFEMGRVFFRGPDGTPAEDERLAVGLLGPAGRTGLDRRRPASAEEAFLWIKGLWEALAGALGLPGAAVRRGVHPALDPETAAELVAGGAAVGIIGLVRPDLALEWRLADPVAVLEARLAPLLQGFGARRACAAVPVYPCVVRDIALIVDQRVTHADVLAAVRRGAPPELERAELFDVFTGPSIGAGRKSLAYSLTFRSAERTLTDDEANRYNEKVKGVLKQELQAEIREG
jgi:phenylalanyl-tRNA synthetase beta chain